MQPCPNCGTSLPDKASFCTSCGHALTAPDLQASPTPGPSEPPLTREEVEILKTRAMPAQPNTPQPGEIQNSEVQMTLIQPPSPNTSSENSSNAGEALSDRQGPENTPLPVPTRENDAQTLLISPGGGNTPLPVTPLPIEDHKTITVFTREKTLPSTSAESNKAPGPQAAPPSQGKPPAQEASIEALNTRALPKPKKTPPPSGTPDIESLSTRVMPSVGKTPPSTPRQPAGEQTTRSMVEAQKTIPVSAVNKPPRSGQTGMHPRTEVYTDGTFVIYKGGPQAGRPLPRTGQTQNSLRAIPPGASTKLPAQPPTLARKVRKFIWRWISPIFSRAADPEPEKQKQKAPQTNPLGWLPVIAVTAALGLFTVATAYNAARDNTPGAELYYWLGLGLIFLPALLRIILPQASRVERVGLLCIVACCLFLTKVMLNPFHFTGYDEFLHWRTINDIMSTGHLFTKNPLLPVSPYYPGLEIIANALSSLSGLSTLQSGYVVAGSACLLMILCLFLLGELLSNSTRLASIAAMIYMTNPHFLFFDTQFAYESMALPLATFVMFAMTRYEMLNSSRRWVLLAAWFVLVAMDFTHHITNFIFEGLFLLWMVIYLFLRPLPLRKSIVLFTLLFGLALTVITVLMIGNTVIGYFTSFFADVSSEIAKTLGSSGGDSRQLFSSTGTPTPLWERLVSLGSVGLITVSTPFFLLCFWRRYRRNTLVWVFALIVVFYPVLQVLRLTASGAEISDRSSPFIFIAISFLAAVAIVQFWPLRLFKWKHSAIISTAILVLFMGGIILGEGIPPSFLPGPYEVSADGRSVDPEGIQAALWTHTYLGSNNRVYTDRVNQLLESVYGDQYLVTKIGDNIDVTDIFFETTVNSYVISRLQTGKIHYLFVDMRLTTAPPVDGFYFEAGEPAQVLTPPLLTKFDTVPQINRLFDSGNIVVYDTGELINAPQKP